MAKERKRKVARPERMKLSPEEILKRMAAIDERKEQIIAAVRKGKNRSVST